MKRAITLLVSGAVAVGSLVAVVANSAYAATACRATYAVTNSWTDGFQASLTIDNLGDPLNGWNVAFTFPTTGQRVTQGWNATWAQTGAAVTATNATWNAGLGHRRDLELGFLGSLDAAPTRPHQRSRSTGRPAPAAAPPTTATTTTRPPTHHHDPAADDDHDPAAARPRPPRRAGRRRPHPPRLEPAVQPGHPAQRGVGAPGEHVPATCTASATTAGTRSWPTAACINYCVRWDSSAPVTATQRDQIHTALSRQFKKWMDVMAGHNGWPYANVPVKVVGWAVRDRSHAAVDRQLGRHLRQQHPRERAAVLRAVRTLLPPGRQLLRLPRRRRPPLRHVAVADRRLRRRRRRRLGPAHRQRVLRRRPQHREHPHPAARDRPHASGSTTSTTGRRPGSAASS